jgi:hypothetical protein
MASVLDQAQNFSGGPIAAARQRDRWARQEANATDPEKREAYREAVADLEARYPDLEDVPIGGAEAFARDRGHGSGARSPVHEGRHRSGSRKSTRGRPAAAKASPKAPAKTGQGKAGTPGLDPTARRSPAQRKAAKGRPTPKLDRAIRQTGIPSTVSSGGSVVMAALGGTVGLSLLYLLFDSAETPGSGAAALPSMISSVTRALGRFLSLEDVFPPGHLTRAERDAAGLGPVSPNGAPIHYPEGPGSDVATAAARLKAAGRQPRRAPTRAQRRERERRPQGHMHR